jgi:Protein of unknown function (DUF2764)
MTSRARYETLLASLPHLPRPERAERLPINHERLKARLGMLTEPDAALLERAVRLVEWPSAPPQAGWPLAEWAELREQAPEPAVRELLAFHEDVRRVLAALRRRARGLAPQEGAGWIARPWARHIALHWDEPDFKLAPVFPWLPEARQHLTSGAAADLERLLARLEWRLLERMAEPDPFRFPAVLAYRFQWGLLARWLAYDRARARARFEHLIAEVHGEQRAIGA